MAFFKLRYQILIKMCPCFEVEGPIFNTQDRSFIYNATNKKQPVAVKRVLPSKVESMQ